jgi:two-component system sensor histidine kinase BaeS
VTRRGWSTSLGGRLLVGHLLVVIAGSVTLAVVALAVAPGLFHDHVRDRLGVLPDDVVDHLDMAFQQAVLVALAVAVTAAVATAVAVSVLATLRIARPVRALAGAAQRIRGGAYDVRAPVPAVDELGALATAFNAMAASLEATERRRSELIADLEHELRTPLATIEGYVEGLADGVVAPSRPTWQVLEAQTRRLRRLVEDLSAVSRAEERGATLHLRRVAPAELVRSAVAAAEPAYAAKGVRLCSDAAADLPAVQVDVDRMGEVLANLLGNALRHTPPAGVVTLAAARMSGGLRLTVSDTGEGIDPRDRPRVFDRFYRGERSRARSGVEGSGIGLTIARALVEAHGGTITLADGSGEPGTRIEIDLPAAD